MISVFNNQYDAKRTRFQDLRDSLLRENTRFAESVTAWRTAPTDDKKEKSLSRLIADHHSRVVEIQQQEIAQLMDSYERYEASDYAVAF